LPPSLEPGSECRFDLVFSVAAGRCENFFGEWSGEKGSRSGMSRSHFMPWVTSAVVHTGMLVILGAALTALPVVAPEVAGNRIVVMSSMADVASPDAVLRKMEHTPPVRVVEISDVPQLPPNEPVPPPPTVVSATESHFPPSPEPLELSMASVKAPSLLQRRRSEQRRSSIQPPQSRTRQRPSRVSEFPELETPTITRRLPDMPPAPHAKPVEVPPVRPPSPANVRPASAARQQSSNSVAQTVGTTPTKPARALSNPNPAYPPEAVQQRLEGRVVLSVTIAASGSVTKVTVAESCGHEVLDQAALDAVCRWRFSPATRGGKPVEWTARLPIRFRL
jgi:protein TonB